MRARATVLGVLTVAMLVVAGCGSDGSVHSTGASSAATSSTAPVATVPATTAATTTERSTTSLATTTTRLTTTTTAPPVTTAAASAPWTRGPLPSLAFPPCCESNWTGTPSPTLTPDPAPLADGVYHATRAAWAPMDPGRMLIAVDRFESCNLLLHVGGCSTTGPPYADDELGIDSTNRRTFSVPLDGSTAVGLAGYGPEGDTATATGSELAALMTALAASYEELIGAPLRAGTPPQQIVDDLTANPRGGFSPAPPDSGGGLLFTFADAPPVLFQLITDFDRGNGPIADSGTAILVLTAVEVRGGKLSLNFYAGFYS